MSIRSIAIAVPVDAAMSDAVNTRQLLPDYPHASCAVSVVLGADLVGTETMLRWYGSVDGSMWVPVVRDGIHADTPIIAGPQGVEVDLERALRWPYLQLELRDATGPVTHTSARTITAVVALI